MTFKDDNEAYEAWLRQQCDVVEKDLAAKRETIKEDPFVFLRGTYFRWAKTIEATCPELKDAPKVLAVGDLHIENFGTWRDADGRLVWGINDFDEAARMAYAFDLVRLVTSARLVPTMRVPAKAIAAAMLAGYRRGLDDPRPTLLDEHATWMREFVGTTDEEREKFWTKMQKLKQARGIPRSAARFLEASYPESASTLRFAHRTAGVGSLGRPRFVALARWRGGHVVREAKALVTSAWHWAHDKAEARSRFLESVRSRHRSPDPWLNANEQLIVRRLAADAIKIELDDLPKKALQKDLFEAMGFDLGAFHGSDRDDARAIAKDLRKRKASWLHSAADHAEDAVRADFKEWKRG
jgi:Uncharacterized protein conserved in bacteria (DUF2252)